jgi:hypothetical protein
MNMRPSDNKLSAALYEANLPELAARAEHGEFNEFFGPHAMPQILLAQELADIGSKNALAVRARLVEGEFDAGEDESEEWGRSADGQAAFGRLLRGK